MNAGQEETRDGQLKRNIGLSGALLVAANGIIGAGIFALPGTLMDSFGTASPVVVLLFGALMLIIASPIAETAALFDRTGGPVAYTAEAFGSFASFQVGWILYIGRIVAIAANSTVFAAYLVPMLIIGKSNFLSGILAIVVIAATAVSNGVGTRGAVKLLALSTILKIAPVLAVVVISLANSGGAEVSFPHVSDLGSSGIVALYAFMGFEAATIAAGETRNSRKAIPKALIIALSSTIAFYLLIQLAYAAHMSGNSANRAPLLALGEAVMGPIGGVLIVCAALFSIFGNIQSSMTATPRLTFALAQARHLPDWMATLSKRHMTPVFSIAFAAALSALLALTHGFEILAIVSILARIAVYLVTMLALPVIRHKRSIPRRFTLRGFAMTSLHLGGIAACIWVLFAASMSAWTLLFVLILLGTGMYGTAFIFRGGSPQA